MKRVIKAESKVFDFNKINYLSIPESSFCGFYKVSWTKDEFFSFVDQRCNRRVYKAEVVGDLNSRYCVMKSRGTIANTSVREFFFTNSLSEAEQEYQGWLDAPDERYDVGDTYHLATLVDLVELEELAHGRKEALEQEPV